jgi:prolyl-tRNA synthetase
MILMVDGKPLAALVRGDHQLNEVKVKNHLKADTVRMANPDEVEACTKAPVGFAGPVGLDIPIIADRALLAREGWVAGANKKDTHVVHLSLKRDAKVREYADLRSILDGEACPRCGGMVETMRGIEVGHVFKLGLKYSKALNAVYLDEGGVERHIDMGCYGVGVTRVVAACIEQNNDAHGIVFPPPVAPFEAVLMNLDIKNPEVCAAADTLHDALEAEGLDVLLDDRDERPGVKFKDADLIGSPMQLVLGAKGFAKGVVEVKDRRSGLKSELPLEGFADAMREWKTEVYRGWNIF